MKLDKKVLDRLCELVALRLDLKEKEALKMHLQEVLSHFENISSVDTKGVAPLFNPLKQTMRLREDEVKSFPNKQEMLDEVPEKQGRLVKAPPAV